MARTKKRRIEKVSELPNVFLVPQTEVVQKVINYFGNTNKFCLEIGCGHANYSFELAQKYPETNFIGIDIKGARIYTAAERIINNSIKNVCFILGKAELFLNELPSESVEQIYIPFPDPHTKRKSTDRRLVAGKYLSIYNKILLPGGVIHLKTDNSELFDYALQVIPHYGGKIKFIAHNFVPSINNLEDYIITEYEKHFIKEGREINYIQFSLND